MTRLRASQDVKSFGLAAPAERGRWETRKKATELRWPEVLFTREEERRPRRIPHLAVGRVQRNKQCATADSCPIFDSCPTLEFSRTKSVWLRRSSLWPDPVR